MLSSEFAASERFKKNLIVWGIIFTLFMGFASRAEYAAGEGDIQQLIWHIEQNAVPTGGYRESTFFFLGMADLYATYYINKTKSISERV